MSNRKLELAVILPGLVIINKVGTDI